MDLESRDMCEERSTNDRGDRANLSADDRPAQSRLSDRPLTIDRAPFPCDPRDRTRDLPLPEDRACGARDTRTVDTTRAISR